MKNLLFPNLSYFKNLDKDQEYEYKLVEIKDYLYLQITFNEDYNNGFFMDVITDGYTNNDELYKCTDKDYKRLQNDCNEIYNKMLDELNNPSNNWWNE